VLGVGTERVRKPQQASAPALAFGRVGGVHD
jgi:hypothetical protein